MEGPKTKKQELLERFDLARQLNADLIGEIDEYARQHDKYDTPFMQGYTFRTGVRVLQEERDLVFNESNRATIINADNSATELDFLIQKIEDQINHYGEIRMGLNVFFKSMN